MKFILLISLFCLIESKTSAFQLNIAVWDDSLNLILTEKYDFGYDFNKLNKFENSDFLLVCIEQDSILEKAINNIKSRKRISHLSISELSYLYIQEKPLPYNDFTSNKLIIDGRWIMFMRQKFGFKQIWNMYIEGEYINFTQYDLGNLKDFSTINIHAGIYDGPYITYTKIDSTNKVKLLKIKYYSNNILMPISNYYGAEDDLCTSQITDNQSIIYWDKLGNIRHYAQRYGSNLSIGKVFILDNLGRLIQEGVNSESGFTGKMYEYIEKTNEVEITEYNNDELIKKTL